MKHEPEQILEAFIAEAEQLLPLSYHQAEYPGMVWEAPRWDYLKANTAKGRSSTVSFTSHAKDGGARFHPRFEFALKAYFVYEKTGSSKANSVVGGARALWSVLLREAIDPQRFRWTAVTQPVLELVERHLLDVLGVKHNSAVIYLAALDNFLDWLRQEGVLPAGVELKRALRLQTPRSLSPEDRKAREERMVTREILTQLADVYTTATEERDRLLICAIGLLLVAGFRLGELVILPVDGLEKEIVNGRDKWYIRYWQKKSGKGKYLEENKRWLSPMAAELAQRLWSELRERTEAARRAARALEGDPTRVRIAWVPEETGWLSASDLGRAFGWSTRQGRNVALGEAGIESFTASEAGLPKAGRHEKFWRRDEIEALLLARRGPLITNITGAKKKQHLSETLLIHFEQFMDPRKPASEVLVRALSRKTIEDFLIGGKNVSPLSADLRARSHGFRHWLNTVANKAGMSAFLISVWMQRANIEHTLFYLHDPLDVAEMARERLRDGQLRGAGAARIYGLDPEARERQIDSIQMAHAAATVICGLDLTHAECPEEKLCELCPHGFYDPENASMRQALSARLQALESNRARLDRLRERGIPVHERQMEQADEAIAEIQRRLGLPQAQLGLAQGRGVALPIIPISKN
jgi:hypothetical protein